MQKVLVYSNYYITANFEPGLFPSGRSKQPDGSFEFDGQTVFYKASAFFTGYNRSPIWPHNYFFFFEKNKAFITKPNAIPINNDRALLAGIKRVPVAEISYTPLGFA